MSSELNIDKNIFGYFKSFTFSKEFNIKTEEFEALYKACISNVEYLKSLSIASSRTLLVNIKGIDRINFARTEAQALKYENLLFSYDLNYETEDKKIQSLNYSLVTPFDSFSSNDIHHELKVISDNIPDNIQSALNLDTPLRESNLKLVHFQFGIEQYGMNKFSNWFFKTPVVLESFYLEAFEEKFKIYFKSELLPEKMIIVQKIPIILDTLLEFFSCDLTKEIKID